MPSMFRPGVGLALALSIACGPEGVPVGPAEQCEIDGPTRIGGRSADWTSHWEPASLSADLISERLWVTWSSPDGPVFLHMDLCGREAVRLNPPELGIDRLAWTRDDGLSTVYGIDSDEDLLYLLDRPETAGVDPPTPVASLPHDAVVHGFSRGLILVNSQDGGTAAKAAGVGAKRHTLRIYDAPQQSIVLLDDQTIAFDIVSDAIILLRDDGRLRRFDLATGADEVLAEGVRAYHLSPAQRYVLWQERVDDGDESVYLRELESGVDVHLTDNEFADWQVGSHAAQPIGDWRWTEDDRFIGLRSSEGKFVRVYDAATATAVPVPDHASARRGIAGEYHLRLGTETPREALWNPATGDVVVWFEGEADGFLVLRRADAEIEYTIQNLFTEEQQLWAVERATRATRLKVSRLGESYQVLSDGRLLTAFSDWYGAQNWPYQLAVIDPDTGTTEIIVDDVLLTAMAGEQTVYYIDHDAPEDGVWAVPLPPKGG